MSFAIIGSGMRLGSGVSGGHNCKREPDYVSEGTACIGLEQTTRLPRVRNFKLDNLYSDLDDID